MQYRRQGDPSLLPFFILLALIMAGISYAIATKGDATPVPQFTVPE